MCPQRHASDDQLDAAAWCRHLVPQGSVYAFLADHRHQLFPPELFADVARQGGGHPSVPAEVVATVMVLQALEGLSDREAINALRRDIAWKVACGLRLDDEGFHPTVLVSWRARLRSSPRPRRIFDAVGQVVEQTGVLKGRGRRVLDSTILEDAVATQDTVTQLVAAIPPGAAAGPKARQVTLTAHDDDRPGKPECAWDDPAAKQALVSGLINDALVVLAAVADLELDLEQAEAVALLALVAGKTSSRASGPGPGGSPGGSQQTGSSPPSTPRRAIPARPAPTSATATRAISPVRCQVGSPSTTSASTCRPARSPARRAAPHRSPGLGGPASPDGASAARCGSAAPPPSRAAPSRSIPTRTSCAPPAAARPRAASSKATGAGARPDPLNPAGLLDEELVEQGEVGAGGEAAQQFAVVAGDPADAQAAEAERLGHHADAERPRGAVDRRRPALGRVELEQAVDLVGHQPEAALLGQRLQRRRRRQRAGRAVREVDHHRPGGRPQDGAQAVQVERPAALVLQRQQGDLGAGGARHLVQRLVAGSDHHDVVAGAEHAAERDEDGLLRAGADQHLVRADRAVRGGDLLAHGRWSTLNSHLAK